MPVLLLIKAIFNTTVKCLKGWTKVRKSREWSNKFICGRIQRIIKNQL